MLAEQGIVSAADARVPAARARRHLRGRRPPGDLRRHVRGPVLLRRAADRCDRAARTSPGRLHTARSRNDIDMTMYRMRQRVRILDLVEAANALRRGADRDRRAAPRDRVPGAHAHAAGAAVDRRALPARRHRAVRARRDARARGRLRVDQPEPARRLRHHRHRVPDRPAPHGAVARVRRPDGQHLRQHRDRRLHAREPLGDGGAARGPRAASCRTCCCGARWSSGYLRLPDGFVQGSSIMPQKRNPVALEHARAIASKALGQAHGRR